METTHLEDVAPAVWLDAHASAPTRSGRSSTMTSARPTYLPSSISWHGTRLIGPAINDAIITVAERLRGLKIFHESRVALEPDDSGRTALTFLALAHLGARIVLVNDVAKLAHMPNDSEAPEAVLLLRQYGNSDPPNSHDVRALFTDIEKSQHKIIRHLQPPELSAWFESPRALGVFTSGTTTGQPQVVWKSGSQLLENAFATARSLGYTRDDVFLPLLPLSGQYGSSVLLIAMTLGAGITFCRRTKVTEMLRTIKRHGVTAVDGPPLVYQHLLDHLYKEPHDLERIKTVRLFGIGGEPLSRTLQEQFWTVTHRHLTDGYGLTQLGNVAFSTADDAKVLVPVDIYEETIVDHQGNPVDIGEIGLLKIRSKRAQLGVAEEQSEYCDTGDLARRHASGFEVLGRQGMINRNGTLLPLAWLERQISRAGITAYAMPTQSRGTQRFTLIIHDPVHEPVFEWRRRIAQVLLPEHHPDTIFTIGNLPLDASGKVSRHRLQSLADGLVSSPHQSETSIDRLRGIALDSRSQLISLVAEVSDQATAEADFAALMNLLDHATAELAYYSVPAPHPVDVFMTRNSLLESFALYCLLPSLWSQKVLIRPARGTHTILEFLLDRFVSVTGDRIELVDVQQHEFVRRIAERPSVVIFTGLRTNAEAVASKLTSNHLFLFFGRGINPVIITEDADLDRAATDIVSARLYNGGQDCLAPDLLLVQDSIAEQLLQRIIGAIRARLAKNQGRLAPIIKRENLHGAINYLLDHSGGLHTGGTVDYVASTLSPAVVEVAGDAVTAPVEHYAPIFSYTTFSHLDEVDELLNSPYFRENGFGVALYGYYRVRARALAGHYLVALNQSLAMAATPLEPFGGHGVESGFTLHRGVKRIGPINITETVNLFLGDTEVMS